MMHLLVSVLSFRYDEGYFDIMEYDIVKIVATIKIPMKMSAFLFSLFLVGCTLTPPRQESSSLPTEHLKAQWETHQHQVEAHPFWQARGRFAVNQGTSGGHASFAWQQAGDRAQIRLHGPFGAGSVVITANPHQVIAQEANGKKHQAASAEQLMQKLVGWYVPITGLRHWVRGLPIPNTNITGMQLDPEGRLKRLVQEGWTIQYGEYTEDSITLPKQLQLHNPKLKIKMVITTWS